MSAFTMGGIVIVGGWFVASTSIVTVAASLHRLASQTRYVTSPPR